MDKSKLGDGYSIYNRKALKTEVETNGVIEIEGHMEV